MPEAQGTPLPPNKLTKINNFSTEAAVLNKHRLSYNGELSRQFVIPNFLLHFTLEVIVPVSVLVIVSCDIFTQVSSLFSLLPFLFCLGLIKTYDIAELVDRRDIILFASKCL